MFSFAAMAVFLALSACAKPPTPEPRASLPAQRNVSAPAPDPCAIPNPGQAYGRDIVSVVSPQLRPSNMRCPDYSRGFPSVLHGWTWPAPRLAGWPWLAPRWEEPPDVAAARVRAEREREGLRQAEKDFQRRKRGGR
jgi:hypothetical protein